MRNSMNSIKIKTLSFIDDLTKGLDVAKNKTHAEWIFEAFCQTFASSVPSKMSDTFINYLPIKIKQSYLNALEQKHCPKTSFCFNDFVETLYESKRLGKIKLFDSIASVEKAIRDIFKVIKQYISDEEYKQLVASLPIALRLHIESDMLFDGQTLVY